MTGDESDGSRDHSSNAERRKVARAFGCVAILTIAVVALGVAQLWRLAPEVAAPEVEHQASESQDQAHLIDQLVDSEEWIMTQTSELSKLSSFALNLQIPVPHGASLFADKVLLRDISPTDISPTAANDDQADTDWAIQAEKREVSLANLHVWGALLQDVTIIHAKFYFISAHFVDGDTTLVDSHIGFEGLAQRPSGQFLLLNGKQKLRWQNVTGTGGGVAQWRITQWDQKSLHSKRRDQLMFQDVMQYAISDPELRDHFRMSQHEKELIRIAREKTEEPFPYFSVYSNARHPSVSVVDIDQDGWDDLYLMPRIGENILLRNQGDGTFVNIAADLGLNIDSFCSSALFADFDNDGDSDLVVGRTLERSKYFVNEGGKFVERTRELWGVRSPMLVYSVSAADYNGDGLLDIFFATGAQHISIRERELVTERNSPFAKGKMMFREFLSPEQSQRAFKERGNNIMFARVGPPNLLLVNRGGRFEAAPENPQLELYRTSTQGSWSDYDGDGDPDLYVSNDFALNSMLRNDGAEGFVDVTKETETGDIGFGKGVSWGDYDNDQRLDLYVSNMYSKAGRRITAQVDSIDQRAIKMANGNTLFRNADDKFTKVSGLKAPKQLVEKVGWSWGSQFADVNNDGFLDIYALSGFYTAPKEVAVNIDLCSDFWRGVVRSNSDLGRAILKPESMTKIRTSRMNMGGLLYKEVERSFGGKERNRLFINRGGEFADLSGVSGLDNPADGRVFVTWDFDLDGWQDFAVVNANRPVLNLYRNRIGDQTGGRGRFVAVRFVGGNTTSEPSDAFTARDGYGAKVFVKAGELSLMREHRCGEGMAAQNSKTMLIGIGDNDLISSLAVQWPSGKRHEVQDVQAGMLVTFMEDPSGTGPDGKPSDGKAHVISPYGSQRRARMPWDRATPKLAVDLSKLLSEQTGGDSPLFVFTTMATWCKSCKSHLPQLQYLTERTAEDDLSFFGVPVDESDSPEKLQLYVKENQPPYRLLEQLTAENRQMFSRVLADSLNTDALPSTIVTDATGTVLLAMHGVPTLSQIRAAIREARTPRAPTVEKPKPKSGS